MRAGFLCLACREVHSSCLLLCVPFPVLRRGFCLRPILVHVRMAQCLIGLGSNLGDRASLLDVARSRLDGLIHTRVIAASRYHETEPIGGPAGQDTFLNGAVLVETTLAPEELLRELVRIESELGRRRATRWGPRAIDLDLLLYEDVVLESSSLQLPHPRMAWRRFVLVPAVEVAPAMKHPTIGWTIERLLDHLDSATDYVAIGGPFGVGKSELAQAAAAQFEGCLIADPVSLDGPPRTSKSYGIDCEAEIEFAERRAAMLDVSASIWNEGSSLWVSDFWLGQSAAVVQALSKGSRREELLEQWRQVTRNACPPKLTVVMDAPSEWCVQELLDCGLVGSEAELLQSVEAVRESLKTCTSRAGLGPVVRLDGQRPAEALEELVAAVLAMKSRTHHEC